MLPRWSPMASEFDNEHESLLRKWRVSGLAY